MREEKEKEGASYRLTLYFLMFGRQLEAFPPGLEIAPVLRGCTIVGVVVWLVGLTRRRGGGRHDDGRRVKRENGQGDETWFEDARMRGCEVQLGLPSCLTHDGSSRPPSRECDDQRVRTTGGQGVRGVRSG